MRIVPFASVSAVGILGLLVLFNQIESEVFVSEFGLFIILTVVILLILTGLLGPSWIKNHIRKLNTWWDKDSSLFFPIDPYRPLSKSLKDTDTEFWPTKTRVQNFKIKLKDKLFGDLGNEKYSYTSGFSHLARADYETWPDGE